VDSSDSRGKLLVKYVTILATNPGTERESETASLSTYTPFALG
jgi:hypothetical protein